MIILFQSHLNFNPSEFSLGFEALTEIQNLLSTSDQDSSIKESLMIDASNRFFTMIPSIHPHVIRDELEFKSKVKRNAFPHSFTFFSDL